MIVTTFCGKDIELNVVKTLYIKYIIDISKKKKMQVINCKINVDLKISVNSTRGDELEWTEWTYGTTGPLELTLFSWGYFTAS